MGSTGIWLSTCRSFSAVEEESSARTHARSTRSSRLSEKDVRGLMLFVYSCAPTNPVLAARCTRWDKHFTEKCLENVEGNLGPRGMSGNVRIRRLEWASVEDLAQCQPPYDMVIAGDCLYEEACISPLLQTICALSGPETEVIQPVS